MTETALLVAQLAVLVLLFGFVWAVVRSSSRTLSHATPPPLPLEDPVERSDTAAHAVPVTPARAAAPAPAAVAAPPATDPFAEHIARRPVRAPLLEDEEEEPPTVSNGTRGREASTSGILSANIEPRLVVEASPTRAEGEVITLGGGLTIGRSRSADLHLDDSYVSHMHARIMRRGSFYRVEDLGSTNGTFLNDQRVESAQLRPRDVLRMGECRLRYEE